MALTTVFEEKDFEVIRKAYASLKESAARRCRVESELEVVNRAFEFANEAHKNIRRRSGDPYILHPIAVAKIVVDEIGLGYKSISAALLHDVVEDTDYTVEDIKFQFGEKIAELVDGLTKIKNVFDNQEDVAEKDMDEYVNSSQAENFKRILLTLNNDVRVVLIKLADRLHNCRTIEYMPEYKRDKILSETMFIFIPLAHRLGFYSIKSELENIWLKYKEPLSYNEILDRINKNVLNKGQDIEDFVKPLEEALRGKFDFYIKKRIKTPYSIWRKMQTKHVTFDEIYDLYAIRIIFNHDKNAKESEREECFHIYSIISSIFQSRQERFRDWVSQSKSNGYEALHCTLMDNKGMNVEVQIRSKRMDDIAEKGIAAHWAYKREGYVSNNDSAMDKWLAKLQETLSNPDFNTTAILDEVHKELMLGEIVVFTPKGAQKTIPKGSTALDFAYQVHTEIGNKAIAAKVNFKPVALSQALNSGDIVEIITAEDAKPQRSSLKYLRSRTARNRVIDWFRSDFSAIREEGYQNCVKDFNMIGVEVTQYLLARIAARKGFNNSDEFLFRYGLGLIPFIEVAELPGQILKTGTKAEKIWTREFVIDGSMVENKNVRIATCCNPIAGDPVIGFRIPNGNVIIHKKSCRVAESEAAKHGDWIVMPQWSKSIHQSFLVRLKLAGIDRLGLLNEITRYISLIMGVNIKGLSISAEEGIVDGRVDLYVQDREVLEELIGKLQAINGITSVERTKA